jgi:UDPglucose 6-dehydrogenase
MKLTIIGTGYVGLVTGHLFCGSRASRDLRGQRRRQGRNAQARRDSHLRTRPRGTRPKERCRRSPQLHQQHAEGVEKSDVIFIAVPTPPQPDGSVDMSFIEKVAREIASAMTSYKIIVDKSTVPVKTGDKVAETIKRYCKAKVEFDVISNPEFLREGFAVEDLMKPDRVVVGVRSQRPVQAMKEVYEPFQAPIIVTDINSAELIKHASNSFLALKISYINAVSVICEATGANVQQVANGMGLDERIGRRFLNASLGFGGSCFPKDLSAFVKISEQVGYDFRLLKEVQRINAEQMERFVKKITETLWVLKDKTIGVLGLAFKQNTDDVRSSPAIDLCQRLLKEGAALRVYDPKAMDKGQSVVAGRHLCRGHERRRRRLRCAGGRHGMG